MARIYSTQLMAFSISVPSVVTFDVPDGAVCIVRDMDAFVSTDTPHGAFGFILSDLAGTVTVIRQSFPPGARMQYEWRGRSVHPGPTQLQLELFGSLFGVLDGFLSGYILT